MDAPSCAKAPCRSCPYRRDVPAGVWNAREYAKLPGYDGETWEQPPKLFFCHQKDGRLCAGWVAVHDMRHNLAVRLFPVAPMVFAYESPVPVFSSGTEAALHGLSGVARPGPAARAMIARLERKLKAA